MSTLRKRLIETRFRARLKAANEARAIERGEAHDSTYAAHVPSDVDVKGIRHKLGMSQDVFAERFGFTAARIRDWEQGRSKPDSAVRAYLIIIDREREAVERALTGGSSPESRPRRLARLQRARDVDALKVRDDKALNRTRNHFAKISNELEALRVRPADRER